MRKYSSLLIILLVFTMLFTSGCTMSKSKYESLVKASLKRIEDQSADISKERAKVDLGNAAVTAQEFKKLDERQTKILEEQKNYLAKVNPPDDFFVGHSDLIEFISLLAGATEMRTSSGNKTDGTRQASAGTQSEALETLGASTQAFSKAIRELPFLEYELKQTFSEIMNDFQSETFLSPKT